MAPAGSQLAHALTWTLAHSLWVGASAALCLAGLLCLIPSRRARWRYTASAGALLSIPLVALWTMLREIQGNEGTEIALFLDAGGEGSFLSNAIAGLWFFAQEARATLASRLAPVETWIARGWILLATLACVRVVGGWALVELDATYRLERAGPELQARLARLARRIGLRRRVPLYWSARAEVPLVAGALRPRIVVPAALADATARGELDLVLLHELAHVRRRDPWARACEAVLEALFVVNPAVRWIVARTAREREHCCDDVALEAGADRLGYVRSLAALEAERRRKPRSGLVLALRATDGPLVERVRRLTLGSPRAPRSRMAAACGGLFLGTAGLGVGAIPTHDAIVQASVRLEEERPAPAVAADPLHVALPVRARRVAGVLVVRAHSGDPDAAPSGFWLSDDLEGLRVPGLTAEDDGAPPRVIQIRALRDSR